MAPEQSASGPRPTFRLGHQYDTRTKHYFARLPRTRSPHAALPPKPPTFASGGAGIDTLRTVCQFPFLWWKPDCSGSLLGRWRVVDTCGPSCTTSSYGTSSGKNYSTTWEATTFPVTCKSSLGRGDGCGAEACHDGQKREDFSSFWASEPQRHFLFVPAYEEQIRSSYTYRTSILTEPPAESSMCV